jgi:membrane associated rhomboid family serine protease
MSVKKLDHQKFRESVQIATLFLVVIWLVHLVQWFSPLDFTHYGILPHRMKGLKGIFFSPFLHSQKSWGHIINNSSTLFAGIIMLYYFYNTVAHRTLLFIYLFTGIAVWGIAGYFVESKYAYHIGASGVVYGLISFIFWSGIFRKNVRAIILSLITVFMYSGMVAGLFPDAAGEISWQGHSAGAFFGMLLAYQYRNIIEPDELQHYEYEQEKENASDQPFLASDTFDKTKQQRADEEWLKQKEEDERDKGFWSSDTTW